MASSGEKSILEAEISAFWALSSRGWHLVRTDITNPEIDEIRDEQEIILLMTASPALRFSLTRAFQRDDARNRHPRKEAG